MFHVEKMKVDDFPFAVELANTIGWNMTVEDFEFMVKLEPQGCFVQFSGNERIGIATTVSFDKAGWFGNFIIKEEFRGKGAGSFLIQNAIDYLYDKGAETIGLYAYPHLVKFYERFGFERDIDFLVLKGTVSFPSTQERLHAATEQNFPEVIDLDYKCFGANRKKLLEPILLEKRNFCYISTENRELTGYVTTKVFGKMAEVGPLICHKKRLDHSLLLLNTILGKLNGLEAFICIPKKETELLSMLCQTGLKEDFSVIRMFLGSSIARNCIYVAESLERG
jgi:predicted GNAT family acetyltransferase